LLSWFISTVGEGIIARSGVAPEGEGGFIIMIMLAFAIWGACIDRGWNVSILPKYSFVSSSNVSWIILAIPNLKILPKISSIL